MSNDQLDEQREADWMGYVADELGITVDDLYELDAQIETDEYGAVLTISFGRDSPAELLGKIKGLSKGQSLRACSAMP